MILQADARSIPLADRSVHCVVTSPPYWGLRDYGIQGQLGLEPTPEAYVASMVAVFREVRRTLRDDGTLWLNLGDSYASGASGDNGNPAHGSTLGGGRPMSRRRPGATRGDGKVTPDSPRNRDGVRTPAGLKPKDMVGIPWRVAFALQADGWWLRSDIVWSKPNPMPESVTDRPTKAHEYIFLLAKRERYYYDAEAIKEPAGPFHPGGSNNGLDRPKTPDPKKKQDALGKPTYTGFNDRWSSSPTTSRNRRTVWEIATQSYPDAHFATFPEALVEPCVLAGTSERGCCGTCGAPWERVVERTPAEVRSPASDYGHGAGRNDGGRSQLVGACMTTTGWQQTCACHAGLAKALVLDPFAGSGTVGLVCHRLGRRFVGLELSEAYCQLAKKRTAQMGLV